LCQTRFGATPICLRDRGIYLVQRVAGPYRGTFTVQTLENDAGGLSAYLYGAKGLYVAYEVERLGHAPWGNRDYRYIWWGWVRRGGRMAGRKNDTN
jgi:hypothetical protein